MKHLAARLDRVLELGRATGPSDSQRLARMEAFEQSPRCSLLATEDQLRIVAANEAMRVAIGYSEAQLTLLSVADIFRSQEDDEALLRQLRNPSPRVPIRARQRTRGGAAQEVEITGYRLRARGRTLLAFIAEQDALDARVAASAVGRLGLAAVMGWQIWQMSRLPLGQSAAGYDGTLDKAEYLNLVQRLLEQV